MAWKRSTMKDAEIQELVDTELLQERAVVGWRSSDGNAWMFEVRPNETPCRENMQIRKQYSDLYLEYELIMGHRPKYSSRWLDEPTTDESIQVPNLLTKIAALKKQGLTRVVVAASFLKRRLQPLQFRQTPAYKYSGLDGPLWMSPDDISDEEVESQLRRMSKELEGEPGAVEEFDSRNKPNEPRVSKQNKSTSIMSRHHADDDVDVDLALPPKKQRTAVLKRGTSEVEETVEVAPDEVVDAAETATNNAGEVAETAADIRTDAVDTAASDMTMAPEVTTPHVTLEAAVTAGGVAGSTETDKSEAVKTPEAVFDATLSEISSDRECMDTSGNRVAAAAQVLATGIGDNPGAPRPAPSTSKKEKGGQCGG
uniref:Uncharacterized protein n=1 Tax=Setaria viridis TaxID=4556 RepID=A0A4U6VDX5_SETVI|nr:hypothetical protein SEVIR_3G213200v2 [Setaria viridis]